MIEKEALERIIDAFVDMLDLETFGFNYYQLNTEGRPPFHPGHHDEDLFVWLSTQDSLLKEIREGLQD